MTIIDHSAFKELPLYWEGVEFANKLAPYTNYNQRCRLSSLLAGEEISKFNKLIAAIVGNNSIQANKEQSLELPWVIGFQDTFLRD